MHWGSSIFTFCPCPGRHPSALALPSAVPVPRPAMCNVARDPIPSSFMGCGRNMTTVFQNIAKFQRRGLDRGVVSSMLDLMPAPRLIFNEWDRHGTCSGQSAHAYFETVRKARAAVKIPPEFIDLKEPLSVTPHAVEEAFIKANPGLSAGAMAVGCDAKRLTEVRLCLSKDLQFRDCAEIAKRSCSREQLTMPPMRGG